VPPPAVNFSRKPMSTACEDNASPRAEHRQPRAGPGGPAAAGIASAGNAASLARTPGKTCPPTQLLGRPALRTRSLADDRVGAIVVSRHVELDMPRSSRLEDIAIWVDTRARTTQLQSKTLCKPWAGRRPARRGGTVCELRVDSTCCLGRAGVTCASFMIAPALSIIVQLTRARAPSPSDR
jgi:hypothetical protein